jgi:diadenosine tetraphosphate (Ap4A) HIT family hydrolase
MRIKALVIGAMLFLAGIGFGGYLFTKTQSRPLLAETSCGNHCYSDKELAGLITSAAILRSPFKIPGVVMESTTCLAIRHPIPQARIHYVLFPKHDIKNIASLRPDDIPYVVGCFAMVRELVQRDKLEKYVVFTNGPGKQEIAYLHFHLTAQ